MGGKRLGGWAGEWCTETGIYVIGTVESNTLALGPSSHVTVHSFSRNGSPFFTRVLMDVDQITVNRSLISAAV